MSMTEQLAHDMRQSVRSLARTPGFTAVALLTLALGIGANAAVFGVLKSVLLDALPYAEADRVARIERPSTRRLPMIVVGAFGGLALLLASVGVYAMFVSMVLAREGEFAVRMALGSLPRGIVALVLRQGAIWMAAGLAGGALGVWQVARPVRGLLYGVSPFDPLVLGSAIAVLFACATVALLIPLRRAAHVAPAMLTRAP